MPTKSNHTILLADDDITRAPLWLSAIQEALGDGRLLIATSEEDLLISAGRHVPSLVVLSDRFGPRGGFDIYDRARAVLPAAQFVLTVDSDRPMNARLFHGPSFLVYVLPRPIDEDKLIRVLRSSIAVLGSQTGSATEGRDPKRVAKPQLRLSPSDRHTLVNHLAFLLTSLRAMEADLNADAEDPAKVRGCTDEYIDRMVSTVHTMASMVALTRGSPRQQGGELEHQRP